MGAPHEPRLQATFPRREPGAPPLPPPPPSAPGELAQSPSGRVSCAVARCSHTPQQGDSSASSWLFPLVAGGRKGLQFPKPSSCRGVFTRGWHAGVGVLERWEISWGPGTAGQARMLALRPHPQAWGAGAHCGRRCQLAGFCWAGSTCTCATPRGRHPPASTESL